MWTNSATTIRRWYNKFAKSQPIMMYHHPSQVRADDHEALVGVRSALGREWAGLRVRCDNMLNKYRCTSIIPDYNHPACIPHWINPIQSFRSSGWFWWFGVLDRSFNGISGTRVISWWAAYKGYNMQLASGSNQDNCLDAQLPQKLMTQREAEILDCVIQNWERLRCSAAVDVITVVCWIENSMLSIGRKPCKHL